MTKEFFELLESIAASLKSLAKDVNYFANKARQEEARNTPPAPAPEPQ